ncbi:MAG: hypothetical protein QOH58_1877 [Thermoleophilaceae bacterium]|jgi:hypothetical protein|nr:hypothetical protein [Thermoleophilaceae bacterium]
MREAVAQFRTLGRRDVGDSSRPAVRDSAGPAGRSHGAQMAAIIAGCLAVSALTLLYPSTPTYDPWAWILWGREIFQLDLVTEGGPSWKPFPLLFTVPFSLFGQDAAPYLWLWVARAGGLFGCAMAYRMANRLIGRGLYGALAGVCAFFALFSSNKFVRDAALGNSEGILAAIVLWAFERHLDGRRDHALYLGVAAALLRPEAWPFLGLYGLWLWLREPALRARLVAFAVLIGAVWILPEWWGSGDPLRAGSRANAPNPGSAAFADSPAIALVERFMSVTIAPVELGTLIAVGFAAYMWVRHRREGAALALTMFGLAWFLLVAAMTEGGFAGNQRYLIVTTAVVCVLGGVGAVRVLQGVEWLAGRVLGPHRARPAIIAAFCLGLAVASPTIVAKANNTARVQGGLEHEAYLWHDLKGLIAEAGGKDALLACGGVFSGPFQTQMVAYELGIHGIQVGWKVTPPPGVTFRTRTVPDGPLVTKPTDDRYRLVGTNGKWRMLSVPPDGRSDCPKASPDAPTSGTAGNVATKDAPLEVIGDPDQPQAKP